MKTKRNKDLIGWKLVEDTVGKMCNGVYVKDDYTEIKVRFAWGGGVNVNLILGNHTHINLRPKS
jgi:hypothetical protein